jgi:hypothetical protein
LQQFCRNPFFFGCAVGTLMGTVGMRGLSSPATANEISAIPEPHVSRLSVFHIDIPSDDQKVAVARAPKVRAATAYRFLSCGTVDQAA